MKLKNLVITAVLATAILCSGGYVMATDSGSVASQIAQLQAQIAQLLAQIKALQAQQNTGGAWCHTFNKNLGFVNSGSSEISALHTALQKEGIDCGDDNNTNKYAEDTGAAVVQFQQKYSITPLSGYVGPKTRAKLNALYGCETTTQPSITVTSPNGGENWKVGETHNITWTSAGLPSSTNIRIDIVNTNNNLYSIATVPASLGTYSWSVGYGSLGTTTGNIIPAGQYKINIFEPTVVAAADSSNNYFTISDANQCSVDSDCPTLQCFVAPCPIQKCVDKKCVTVTQPSITITSPTSNVLWKRGTLQTINWTPSQNVSTISNVDITLVSNSNIFNGSNSLLLIGGTNPGTYSWYAGNWKDGITSIAPDGDYKIWICPHGTEIGSSVCGNFNVNIYTNSATPSITVTSPNGGENYTIGQTIPIRWSVSSGFDPLINITLIENIENTNVTVVPCYFTITSQGGSQGVYNWTIPSQYGSDYCGGFDLAGKKFKITISAKNSSGTVLSSDQSDNYFTISAATQPSITSVVSANGVANQLVAGPFNNVTLTGITYANILSAYIRPNTPQGTFASIGYGAVSSNTIHVDLPATVVPGTYNLTLNTTVGNVAYGPLTVVSANTQPSITVTSPNGGETWKVGETHNITWTSSNLPYGDVSIQLINATTNVTEKTISYGTPAANGSYPWTISEIAGGIEGNWKIIVFQSAGSVDVKDTSNNYFTIAAATATCTDSDNGINYNVKGFLNTNYPSWLPNSPDKCATLVGPGNYQDSNTCSGSNCYIVELYCDDNHNPQRSITTCPNGCSDGACVQQTTQPSITVTSPNGGETWKVGETHNVSWTYSGLPSSDNVILSYQNSASGYNIATNVSITAGTYSFTIPSVISPGTYQIEIYDTNKNSATNTYITARSNNFTIAAAIPCLNGAGPLLPGQSYCTPTSYNVSQNSLASIADAIANILEQLKLLK